jgi:hypothetical protein
LKAFKSTTTFTSLPAINTSSFVILPSTKPGFQDADITTAVRRYTPYVPCLVCFAQHVLCIPLW